ncbi:MAG TPA: hypothetical protein PLL10_08030 [Elusimicrobiales bacterium]|nr:hypothetical protein [Elusimicrobiales bacterium]
MKRILLGVAVSVLCAGLSRAAEVKVSSAAAAAPAAVQESTFTYRMTSGHALIVRYVSSDTAKAALSLNPASAPKSATPKTSAPRRQHKAAGK